MSVSGSSSRNREPGDLDAPWGLVPSRWLSWGVLVVIASVWLPTLGFGFVYDDHWVLLDNGFIRDASNLGALLDGRAVRDGVPDAFRPASVAFDSLSMALVGTSEIGQHAISILLHLVTAAALGLWLGALGCPLPLRIGTVAIFGAMAIHAEAVAVVSYREDLLAAGLGLLACICAQKALPRPDRPNPTSLPWWSLSFLLMSGSAAAKLSAAPLPLLWLAAALLRPWDRPRPTAGTWLGFGVLAAAVATVLLHRMNVLGGIDPYGADSLRVFAHRAGLSPVLAASTQIHAEYLTQMVLPHGLSPEHVDFAAAWSDPATLLCAAGLLGVLGLGVFWAIGRRRPLGAWIVLGFVLLALPTANVAGMPNMRADRFMYLPSMMPSLALAGACLQLGQRWRRTGRGPAWAVIPLLAFVVLQGAMARGAAAAYRSDARLWTLTLRHAPHSARAHGVFGELLVGRLRSRPNPAAEPALRVRARTHCLLARRLDPLDAIGELCLARLATVEKDWSRARTHFERAATLEPVRRERAWVALASVLLDAPDLPYQERIARAADLLERAQRAAPYSAEVLAVSAHIHHRLGRAEPARDLYRRASAMRPDRWDIVLNRLELELDLGHISAAANLWDHSQPRLRHADPVRRDALRRRLVDAHQLF